MVMTNQKLAKTITGTICHVVTNTSQNVSLLNHNITLAIGDSELTTIIVICLFINEELAQFSLHPKSFLILNNFNFIKASKHTINITRGGR